MVVSEDKMMIAENSVVVVENKRIGIEGSEVAVKSGIEVAWVVVVDKNSEETVVRIEGAEQIATKQIVRWYFLMIQSI